MAETPSREQALNKLQTDLLEFVLRNLQERVAKGEIPEITSHLADSVNARVATMIKATAERQADSVAEQILVRLKGDAPQLFEGRYAKSSIGFPLSQAPGGASVVRDLPRAPAPSSAEEGHRGIRRAVRAWMPLWPALAMLMLAFLLAGGMFSWKLYSLQAQQLARERGANVSYQNDLNQACGIYAEIKREAALQDDRRKYYCTGSPDRMREPACAFSDKLKRWQDAMALQCETPRAIEQ